MNSKEQLREATVDELSLSIQHALRYDGRRRVYHADEYMARLTADHLIKKLAESGYIIMKKPPACAPSTTTRLNSHLKD